jgi:hypothetical protein
VKRREFRLELAESKRSVAVWTTHRGAVWTSDAVKAGLIRFYRDVTGLPRNIVPWGFEDYAHRPRTPFIDDPHLSLPPFRRRQSSHFECRSHHQRMIG